MRAALVGGLLASLPALVHAGDALRERTPVVHLGETCMTLVDRAATPVVHLEYSFPIEDTCAGTYPAPTHQFLALCRPPAPGEVLPQWVSRADIAASEAAQIPLLPITPADVLEDSPAWTDCWTRVTNDDDRKPLTCEVARAGVDWDVSMLAPGAYVIAGYTYQPPKHLWSPRWGIFKIFDGDPDGAPPVAAIATREAFVYADQELEIAACVSAATGSTLRIEYARHEATPTWSLLAELAVNGPMMKTPWTPPPDVHGEDVRLRVTVTDPLARTGVLEAPELLHVLAVPDPTAGPDDPPGEPVDMCADETPASLYCPPPRGTSGSSSEATGETDEPAGAGCACTHTGAPPWALLLLVLARRRRLSRR